MLGDRHPSVVGSVVGLAPGGEVYAFFGSTVAFFAAPGKYNTLLVLHGEAGGPWRVKAGDYIARSLTAAEADDDTFTAASAHGLVTGQGPYKLSGSTLPTGVNTTTLYWVVKVDATKFKLATSRVNATLPTPLVVDLTTDGTPSSWNLGGLPAAPAASITDGYSSLKMLVNERLPMAAPRDGITVIGTGSSDILTMQWLD